MINFSIALLPLFFIQIVNFSQGLECHNCYSFTDDLKDCMTLSVEELGGRLLQNKVTIGSGTPPSLAVTRTPDACIMFDTQFSDTNGTKRHAVVRTQINQQASSLFANQKLTDICKIRSDGISKLADGSSISTRYCACTADFCNGSTGSTNFSLLIFIISSSLFLLGHSILFS